MESIIKMFYISGSLDISRGRGVDRKTSKHLDKSISNVLGRPSISQSGRFSSARLSAQPSSSGRGSGAGKADKKGTGSKAGKDKGKRK